MDMTTEDKAKLKEKREDCAGKMLKEKGEKMNRTDKAFVKMFEKKDATVPTGLVPTRDPNEQ